MNSEHNHDIIAENYKHKLNKCTKDKYDLDYLACELKTVLKASG